MVTEKQRAQAQAFSAMHREQKLFVLPNAWDVGSAVIFEQAGFQAIATTSAGVAHSFGLPDGEQIAKEDILYLAKKITDRIDTPLSVDFERGFGMTPEEVKHSVSQLLSAGAVGFNLEDGLPDSSLTPVGQQVEKIKAICELKRELELDFVVNARTCTYLNNVASEEEMLEIATARGNAYLEAGADCIFVPGYLNEATISALANRILGTINILQTNTTYDFPRLEALGVRRASIGSALARKLYGEAVNFAQKLKAGDTKEMLNTQFTLSKSNEYFLR